NNELQQKINDLQMTSELSTVHFELGIILEKSENLDNIEKPIFSKIFELRQSIGNIAIEVDKLTMKMEPNINRYVEELCNLKQPLFKLQSLLFNSESEIQQKRIIIQLLEPLKSLQT
ncbi:PREDICTED: uncharacterized protein LOC105360790, partial [Ceratosolen solmsi marchali]|uniref:Uncharacterized protein LOC105360790 n=1 Tax=Ceratosolen solmsi marchali TaxID=326594 RepID=A0AAJ6YDJ6_9HYME